MEIKMNLLSDLCLNNIEKMKKYGKLSIDGEELLVSLYAKANELLNIFKMNDVEYINYNEIIKNLFKEKSNYLRILDGRITNCQNKNLDKKFVSYIIEEKEVIAIKKGCSFCFTVKVSDDKKYINFIKMCIIGTRYMGMYNDYGMGEVELEITKLI